jgi:D-tyrosyl-tRNA(Tyr) deacylase
MRVLVQLVLEAHVDIAGKTVGQTGRGFLLFVGFTQGDTIDTLTKMADKVTKLTGLPRRKRQDQ